MDPQLLQLALKGAPLVARQVDLCQLLLQLVQLFFTEFARGEQDHLGARFARRLQKHLVVGVALHVPQHGGQGVEPARFAAKHGKLGVLQVPQHVLFEGVEIKVHGVPRVTFAVDGGAAEIEPSP
ncbi:MAG TPA: hypothetical protein DEQ47_08610, partial [Solibacterales bacterium]|nr:hypothetical protein [Bryobacterales bacterium]